MHDASAIVPPIPDYFATGVSTRDDLWRNLWDADRQTVLAQGQPIARQPTAQTSTGIRIVTPPDGSKLIGLQDIKAVLNNASLFKMTLMSCKPISLLASAGAPAGVTMRTRRCTST